MDNFSFYAPTYFAFGKGAENRAGELVKKFGGTKVLLHYGGGSVVRSGLLDRVKDSLKAEGIAYAELGGVKPNPRSGLVYEGIELCRKEGVDFILAVGGGSTIDSSKAIAAGTVYDGDFWDFYEGKPVTKALPVGTVLTIAAAGSEGSPDSVITKEEGMFKRGASGPAYRPKFSILNPELTCTLPAYQTACGATDIIAHLYERYITSTTEVEVTDALMQLDKIGKKEKGDESAKANYLIANFYYNVSRTGYYRHYLRFDNDNAFCYRKYSIDADSYKNTLALSDNYLEKAKKIATDRELLAHIVFAQAKNAQEDMEVTVASRWDYTRVVPDEQFDELDQYEGTDYYDAVRTNCLYFSDYHN